NQKHGTARIPQRDKFSMDELDSPDVDTSGGLRNQQQFRRKIELPADDEFLLISAGQRARGQIRIGRPHVEVADDRFRSAADAWKVQQNSAVMRNSRLAVMHTEDGILRKIGIQQQPATVSIF